MIVQQVFGRKGRTGKRRRDTVTYRVRIKMQDDGTQIQNRRGTLIVVKLYSRVG